MPLPTNRTTANTPAEHVSDHNTLHALHNSFEGTTPATFQGVAQKGAANGYAPLDANSDVPVANCPPKMVLVNHIQQGSWTGRTIYTSNGVDPSGEPGITVVAGDIWLDYS